MAGRLLCFALDASSVGTASGDLADYIFDPGDGGKQGGDGIRVLEGVR